MCICWSECIKHMSVSVPCSGFLLAAPFSLLADLSQLSKLFTNHRRPASRTHYNKWKVRQNRKRCLRLAQDIRFNKKIKKECLHTRFKLPKLNWTEKTTQKHKQHDTTLESSSGKWPTWHFQMSKALGALIWECRYFTKYKINIGALQRIKLK